MHRSIRRGAPHQWHKPAVQRNAFHSTAKRRLQLAYDKYEAPNAQGSEASVSPIIFMHGLFGSKKNNRSMSKVLARDLNRPVYALDLRNHGDSPHDPKHDYLHMAIDVEDFITEHKLQQSILIGHSMGAKVAMTLALRQIHNFKSIVSVDNAPIDAALKSDFAKYVQAMRRISDANLKTQREADAILASYEPSLPIRQFLLTNLVRNANGLQKFRIPIETLGKALDNMADFPFRDPDQTRWIGRALFVRGKQSQYCSDDALPIIGRFFPRFEICDIDCGHWVISEKPEDFRRAVVEFLQEQT